MTSRFDQVFEQATPRFFEVSGDFVVYTPVSGVGRRVAAVVHESELIDVFREDGHERQERRVIEVRRHATCGVLSPAIGDEISVGNSGSDIWRVLEIPTQGPSMATLVCAKRAEVERTLEQREIRRLN